jgi:5'(3')-deoxyribonucleotidase
VLFLDMDGVLCDFHGRAAEEFGCDVTDFTEWAIWEPMGLSEAAFWKWLGTRSREWWASLDPYPWAQEVVDAVRRADPEFRVLSAASKGFSVAGKIDWFEKHFGDHFSRFHFTSQKSDLAGPGRVLIDDNDANCESFSASGGKFILFPQPWNKAGGMAKDRLEWLEDNLEFRREFLCQ